MLSCKLSVKLLAVRSERKKFGTPRKNKVGNYGNLQYLEAMAYGT